MSVQSRDADELMSSGVSWLGPIPTSWSVAPLKRVTSHVSRGMSPSYADYDGVPIINQACVYWDGLRWDNIKFHDRSVRVHEKAVLSDGDVLINSTGTGTLGRVALFRGRAADERVLADSHVTVVRTTAELEPRVLRYLLETNVYQGFVLSVLAAGATNQIELSRDGLRRTPVPLPPIDEQRAIADFLDRKTAAIDALIAKKERLIELLEEKRQALITQAVTKGLDPNVPMKDSGIDWLGPIPAHWQLKRLKYVSSGVSVGIVITPAKYYDDAGTVPAIRGLNVRPRRLVSDELVYISDESNELLGKSRLRAGDLVAVRTGQPGTTAVIPPELDGSNCVDLIIIRQGPRMSSGFVCEFMNSGLAHRQYTEGSEGAIQQHFNIETAKNLLLPVPPLVEQEQLFGWLTKMHLHFDSLVSANIQHVERLREYRQALITAAVTGKIDVTREPMEISEDDA